jgi:hypothetical protein
VQEDALGHAEDALDDVWVRALYQDAADGLLSLYLVDAIFHFFHLLWESAVEPSRTFEDNVRADLENMAGSASRNEIVSRE